MASQTPAPSATEARSLAIRLADGFARVLKHKLVAVVLHGSLTLGDYVAGRSDLDLLVLIGPRLDSKDIDMIREMLAEALGSIRRIDIRFVRASVAASPPRLPPVALAVEIAPEIEGGYALEASVAGERDMVIELSMCRDHGESLIGPPPDQLISEIPKSWVLEVGDRQLADWQAIGDDPAHAELTVLTACRIWRFAVDGHHYSKLAAAEWAHDQDPNLSVIQNAILRRTQDASVVIDPLGVQVLLEKVRAVVRLTLTRFADYAEDPGSMKFNDSQG